jgi:hypothetical protein
MKFILFFISLLCSSVQQEKPKLNGVYKIVFDKKYVQQNCQITFSDSIFRKVMPDAVMYKGKIKYEKFRAIIKNNNDDNPIEIDKKEFNKDTIKFTTKSYIDLSKTINKGIMIRVK